jgi:hypothetical protein
MAFATLVAAAAIAPPPASAAVTCSYPGVTAWGSGSSRIEIHACRGAVPVGMQREYGLLHIGATATRATSCTFTFDSYFMNGPGSTIRWPESSFGGSCTSALRRGWRIPFWGRVTWASHDHGQTRFCVRIGGNAARCAYSGWRPF